MNHILRHTVVTAFLVFSAAAAHAQLPSFPGAEGAGSTASGGRGTAAVPTTVFEVTSLADDNSPGTLRWSLRQPAACRTILFRVSGTIHLTSRLVIRGNTTIAGQTAPGDGICIADYPTAISGDNVIVRYLRFRLGDRHQLKTDTAGHPVDGSGGDDAFGNLGNKRLMIDHCSFSWSNDEACTIYRGDSVTIQWCFITEPLNYSYHFEAGDHDFERHGYGGIWGARTGSFHHNLFAHCQSRNPRFAGSSTYPAGVSETCDFRNNVIYNWGLYTIYGGEGGHYNLVSNYYRYGPSTGKATRYRIVNIDSSAALPYAQYYLEGNYVDGAPAFTANNWLGVKMKGPVGDTARVQRSAPFVLPVLKTETAAGAYLSVLDKAGAVLPLRDTLDRRIVQDVQHRTGAIIDVQGGYPHGTAYGETIAAWPVLRSIAAPADGDRDGMPDYWEHALGLDPDDPADRNYRSRTGYTNLEDYLNGIAGNIGTNGLTGSGFRIYPDAASNRLVFEHTAGKEQGNVEVYDRDGRKIAACKLERGSAKVPVATAGVCYLVIRSGSAAYTATFVPQ